MIRAHVHLAADAGNRRTCPARHVMVERSLRDAQMRHDFPLRH
jgi:hypothetical protein